MNRLACRDVAVSYGHTSVLRGVDLDVAGGEVVALLAGSGSGKTTLLKAVAGILPLDDGVVAVDERLVASSTHHVPPERRSLAMAFQHYALWPHLAAIDTIAYPLLRRGVAEGEARRRAAVMLDRVGLDRHGHRRPDALSGGQQQRVGLARALVADDVAVVLLDEPTSQLDAPLAGTMRDLVVDIVEETGMAALVATHDRVEALGMASRVAVLVDGAVAQVGSPVQVYEEPSSGTVARLTGPASVLTADAELPGDASPGDRVVVRPEWASLGGALEGTVERVRFEGPVVEIVMVTQWGRLALHTDDAGVGRGDDVKWSLGHGWVLDRGGLSGRSTTGGPHTP